MEHRLPTRLTAHGDRVIFKTAFANIAHLTAPLRRLGASSFARVTVIIIGLSAMTAYTVPELQRSAGGWLVACLWSCLGYFAIDSGVRARMAIQAGLATSSRRRVLSI